MKRGKIKKESCKIKKESCKIKKEAFGVSGVDLYVAFGLAQRHFDIAFSFNVCCTSTTPAER
jgi:hypothetical protein